MADFKGKRVVMTGASRGVGYESCVRLLKAGADLTLKNDAGNTPLHWASLNGACPLLFTPHLYLAVLVTSSLV